jgi:hypothetical protein
MNLKDLIKTVKELELITNTEDIDFLFVNYPSIKDTLPLETQIENVLEWGYENDELEDFYVEHMDALVENGFSDIILECKIFNNCSIQTTTIFELYLFQTKNKKYFKVIGSGIFSDSMDTYGFYKVIEKTSKEDIIQMFKEDCNEVFTNNGEIDFDELIKDGDTISFYYY